jgi:hypothetical protein
MVGTGVTTEINDSRLGLQIPDADNAVFVTPECVADFEKAGFRVRELTIVELMQRVADAIQALPNGRWKTVLNQAFGSLWPDA